MHSQYLFIYIPTQFDNVIEGAKYVVAEAYRLWLTYDERTDDISMIVIKIEDMEELEGAENPPVMISRQMSSFDVSYSITISICFTLSLSISLSHTLTLSLSHSLSRTLSFSLFCFCLLSSTLPHLNIPSLPYTLPLFICHVR